MSRRQIFEDRYSGQRFTILEMRKRSVVVFDLDASQPREVNRLAWDTDVESGRLRPARAGRRVEQLLEPKAKEAEMPAKEAMMAGKKQKVTTADLKKAKILTVKPLKKAKPAGAVVNKPVRDGSVKAHYFQALMKGGTAEQVAARLKGNVKGKVTPAKVQKFGGWAVKRGLVTANKANGVTRFAPGKVKLEVTGGKK